MNSFNKLQLKFFICFLYALLLGIFILSLEAQVKLVTLPGRDAVFITIYKNHDLTLVKEQRSITLKKGINTIQFSWTDAFVDPTSLQLKSTVHPDKVKIKASIFPPRQKNVVLWKVESAESFEEKFEVSYFISGLSWNTNYISVSNTDEKYINLKSYVTVSNNSGEDFEDSETRLVVGEIHLVEEVREIAEKYKGMAFRELEEITADKDRGVKKEAARSRLAAGRVTAGIPVKVQKEAVSEYYIYSLEGKETIKNKWQKRLLSFKSKEIPVEVFYKYEGRVKRYYRFVNDSKHKLGKEPLPAGEIQVFRMDESGNLSHIGQTILEFMPIGSKVELDLGYEPEVKVERKLMNFSRINLKFSKDDKLIAFDTEQEVQFEVNNYKPRAIELEVYEHIGGQWEIISNSHDYIREDANTIKFVVELEAGASEKIEYRVRIFSK